MIIENIGILNDEEKFVPGCVFVKGERIEAVGYSLDEEVALEEKNGDDEIIDGNHGYLIPGLCNIHFHGAAGQDFCNGTQDAIQTIADYCAEHGILEICPATMTFPEEKLTTVMRAAAEFKNESGADLVGINMEGPFISPNKVGAQNPAYVQAPDIEMLKRLDDVSGGLIKIVDVAPEVDGGIEFIKSASKDFKVSIAHTCCDYDTAKAAFDAGASHVTHVFNAMNGIHHREPGPIAAARDANAEIELICDGNHVHPAVMRMVYSMFGDDKVIMIDDCCCATGGVPGCHYYLGGQEIIARDGVAYLCSDPSTIAASATNVMDCLRFAIKEAKIPFVKAIQSATINACKSIGIDSNYGSIEAGKIANMVLLSDNLVLNKIFRHGKLIKEYKD